MLAASNDSPAPFENYIYDNSKRWVQKGTFRENSSTEFDLLLPPILKGYSFVGRIHSEVKVLGRHE